MNQQAIKMLSEMIETNGMDVVYDQSRCSTLIKDYVADVDGTSLRTERLFLLQSLNEEIPRHLLKEDQTLAVRLSTEVSNFQSVYRTDEDTARWVVEAWAIALKIATEAECAAARLAPSNQSRAAQRHPPIRNAPPGPTLPVPSLSASGPRPSFPPAAILASVFFVLLLGLGIRSLLTKRSPSGPQPSWTSDIRKSSSGSETSSAVAGTSLEGTETSEGDAGSSKGGEGKPSTDTSVSFGYTEIDKGDSVSNNPYGDPIPVIKVSANPVRKDSSSVFHIKKDQPFDLTIEAVNHGGEASVWSLTVDFDAVRKEDLDIVPEFPSSASGTDSYISYPGEMVPDKKTGQLIEAKKVTDPVRDPVTNKTRSMAAKRWIAEANANGSTWGTGGLRKMKLTVTPHKSGSMKVWARATLTRGSGDARRFFSVPNPADKDQQGFDAKVYQMEIGE